MVIIILFGKVSFKDFLKIVDRCQNVALVTEHHVFCADNNKYEIKYD